MHIRLPFLTTLLSLLLILSASISSQAGDRDPAGTGPAAGQVEEEALDELERGARTLRLTGDLDAIRERGYIRVLVPYSKTYFFYEGARPRGLAYEFMEEFAQELRKSDSGNAGQITVFYLPMPRDRLIPGIIDGLGDIAIGGLTATKERQQAVDFVINESNPVAEVIVTGPGAPDLDSIEALSGKKIFVRPSSSYHESLQALNKRFRSESKPEVRIVDADENLEVEDILELVASGVEQITVADDFLAYFWSEVIESLTVHQDLAVREGAFTGPVIRQDSPQLLAALTAFQKTHGLGTVFGNVVVNKYLRDNPWVKNPNASEERKRFEQALPIFRKYALEYNFDELLLVAQGYQESKLDQSSRSSSGAVGVMQIKPSTAAGEPIGIPDVAKKVDNNIHAGVKYLRHLVDDYFNDPDITPFNRHVFAIAAYNAGPARIQSLRKKAEAQGLDPNIWFNHVELVSARVVGRQNTDYVRNILKYWVAYRLAADIKSQES